MNATIATSFIKRVESILSALALLNLGGYHWPSPVTIHDGDTFDFIVVGAGTAGCVITNRLIELGNVSVLLIEAGGNPPFESELPGLFTYLKQTKVDWNFTSTPDPYVMFAHENNVAQLVQGKMIGGSGSLNYMGYERGNEHDYDRWAELTNDTTWSWSSVLPTFKKNEQLIDDVMLASLDKSFYGTEGKIKIQRQRCERNDPYFAAFKELGWDNPIDFNSNTPLGISECLYNIGDDRRQSTAREFLSPIKDDSNLHVATSTLATKIIFGDDKKVVGVEVITESYEVLVVKANIEVIISAGAIKSPQLLMLSGIGPQTHLEKKGIKVIADLPVGKNFQDHVNTHLVYKVTKAKKGRSADQDPHKYPTCLFEANLALNKSQKYPNYQVVGANLNRPEEFLGFCAFYLNFNAEFCDQLSQNMVTHDMLLVFITNLYPKSRGEILLSSTDPFDQPVITPGYYTNEADVTNHVKYAYDFNRVMETSYFKTIGAKNIYSKLKNCQNYEEGSEEFWRCYVVGMSSTAFYYAGSCGMASVLDSRLRVIGVEKLRVIDASSFPDTVGGYIQATVIMVAQKGAEFIIEDHFQQ